MPSRFLALLISCPLMLLTACGNGHGLNMALGWKAEIITEWDDFLPDMLVLSDDGRFLFASCETRANMLSPSLARIDLTTGTADILLYGLERADGLKLDQGGSLWLGEESSDGLIWKVPDPHAFPAGQRIDRVRLTRSNSTVTPVLEAGRFAHEGLSFSRNGTYLYLADEWIEGCLYRLSLQSWQLQVLHKSSGWLDINRTEEARLYAEKRHGRIFRRLEDMEMLSDGRVLLAETGAGAEAGRILVLDDRGVAPAISVFLEDARLHHPDNLEWDSKRNWLWITDDDEPSALWVWNGKDLQRIAMHDHAEITGVESATNGDIYINLQHRRFGSDLTLRLIRTH